MTIIRFSRLQPLHLGAGVVIAAMALPLSLRSLRDRGLAV